MEHLIWFAHARGLLIGRGGRRNVNNHDMLIRGNTAALRNIRGVESGGRVRLQQRPHIRMHHTHT